MNLSEFNTINLCINNICEKPYEQSFQSCISSIIKKSTTLTFSQLTQDQNNKINHCFQLSYSNPPQTRTTRHRTTTLLNNNIQTTS